MKILYLEKVDSTNNYLKNYSDGENEDMIVVWSDYQSAGRGCGTNHWESEYGKNLTFSILLHPRVPARHQFILSMANAMALRDTLSQYTSGISIKWPNDIYWGDKKICGTLIESSLSGSAIKDCIIGTGINVNQQQFFSDAPNPVSLKQIIGKEVDRKELLDQVVASLGHYLDRIAEDDWMSIRESYRTHLYRKNEVHSYRYPDGREKQFKMIDVSDDGHLLLQHPDNLHVESFAFKEIQFVI